MKTQRKTPSYLWQMSLRWLQGWMRVTLGCSRHLGWHDFAVEIIGTMAGELEFWLLLFFKRGTIGCVPIKPTPVGLPGNVYSRVLEKRLWMIIKPQVLEEQCPLMSP